MFKKIKEFFVGTPPTEKHPLDAVTTPKIPETFIVPETVIVAAPYKVEPPTEQMIPIPYVPEATPAVVETPAKAPRKPRAPKAAPVAAVKEKAPAKAKTPKLTVVKTAKSKKV